MQFCVAEHEFQSSRQRIRIARGEQQPGLTVRDQFGMKSTFTPSTECRFPPHFLESGPDAAGNALLNLATGLLRDKLPADKATVATNILQTAVQLAVTAVKAQ